MHTTVISVGGGCAMGRVCVCGGGGYLLWKTMALVVSAPPALTHPSASRRSAGCGMLRSARAQCAPFLAEGDAVVTPGLGFLSGEVPARAGVVLTQVRNPIALSLRAQL